MNSIMYYIQQARIAKEYNNSIMEYIWLVKAADLIDWELDNNNPLIPHERDELISRGL